jgi:hypothetical protein
MALSNDVLVDVSTIETALGITPGSEDALLERLIEAASSRIKRYCNRTFYYEVDIVELMAGYGTTNLVVSRRPIKAIDQITFDGSLVSSDDYKSTTVARFANAGIIFNRGGWYWPVTKVRNIARDPSPGSEDPLYEVTYTGGWVTPEQGRTGSITAFTDAGGGQVTVTSALHRLSNGETVVITGTTNYNGTFVVANVDTNTYEITDTWVADDATGTWTKNGFIRDLPYDLEQAAVELVASLRRGLGRDPSIKSEKLLSWAATYKDDPAGIPASIRSKLDPYTTPVIV